ncbi:MAG TPA: hypothetical protein VGM45_11995 [Gaiellaceae bacterium]
MIPIPSKLAVTLTGGLSYSDPQLWSSVLDVNMSPAPIADDLSAEADGTLASYIAAAPDAPSSGGDNPTYFGAFDEADLDSGGWTADGVFDVYDSEVREQGTPDPTWVFSNDLSYQDLSEGASEVDYLLASAEELEPELQLLDPRTTPIFRVPGSPPPVPMAPPPPGSLVGQGDINGYYSSSEAMGADSLVEVPTEPDLGRSSPPPLGSPPARPSAPDSLRDALELYGGPLTPQPSGPSWLAPGAPPVDPLTGAPLEQAPRSLFETPPTVPWAPVDLSNRAWNPSTEAWVPRAGGAPPGGPAGGIGAGRVDIGFGPGTASPFWNAFARRIVLGVGVAALSRTPHGFLGMLIAGIVNGYREGGPRGILSQLSGVLPVFGDTEQLIQAVKDYNRAAIFGDDAGRGDAAAGIAEAIVRLLLAAKAAGMLREKFGPGTAAGGRAPEFGGGSLSESEFLDSARKWLGDNYTEPSPGRFLSKDGLRQVRYGKHEVTSAVHHGHFEAYDAPGGRVVENTQVTIRR